VTSDELGGMIVYPGDDQPESMAEQQGGKLKKR
jgi:hypothetical protein